MPLEPIQPSESQNGAGPTIDVVIPVYNEATTLATNVTALRAWLDANLPWRWRIVIADNASTDATLTIARALAVDDRVRVLHLDRKGRGRALKAAWLASDADIVAYMDVDLSTNLRALPPLLAPLVAGESDIAIGSRLRRGAVVTRQWKREALSRGYNVLIRALFRPGFSDAQCGFKALTRETAQALLPAVENDEWFFDTELLLLAAARGVRIREIPVEWIEDLDSRVDIPKTIREDLHGLWRMRFGRRPRSDAPPAPPRRIGHSDIGRSAAP
jgi:glycosyltransferase involved in cell wall biosynthesis